MKYFIVGVFAFSLMGNAIAQKTTDIISSVSKVTVYPRGAQVEHQAEQFLSSGRQILKFVGLPSELDPASIGVSATNGINVLSVSAEVNPLQKQTLPPTAQLLKDSLDSYEFDLKFNQNMMGVYQEERKMILANQKVGWESSDFVIEDIEDLSDFYRERLADIMLKEMQLQSKQERLKRNISRVSAALEGYNNKLRRSTGEVLVEVMVPSNGNVKFNLSYMVYSAGWTPTYNVNAAEIDQPLQMSYNAKVFQNTGLDWDEVALTLTNANPSLSGNIPVLHPWRLEFVQTYEMVQSVMSNRAMPASEGMPKMLDKMRVDEEVAIDYPANEAVTQFSIKTKHNIPTTGKPQVINIDVFTVPASYKYYTAPKIDPSAFLIAQVPNFEQYDLLPGEANLFLANTFVGKTFLNTGTVADTLDLSLGRDQSIVIKREKVKDFGSSKKIGNARKESIAIQITVKNTKKSPIQLVIEDQIPISSDKEIEVLLEDGANAKHDLTSGKLRWNKDISSGDAASIKFIYHVKYPSDRAINF
jgi:uncharacterized protein (TIGR02231 family)